LAIDPARRRLFIGCRGSNNMVVMNCDTGKILATLPIGQHCDGCAFDPTSADAFASCGDGTLAIIHEISPNQFGVIQTLQTKPGARTMALDPKSHQIYLPTSESNNFEILVVGK
jgi:DNA-binding beta-propeller fold protein YncE